MTKHVAKRDGRGGRGRGALRRLRRGMVTDLSRNPLYRQLALGGPPPKLLEARLPDLRPGNTVRGRTFMRGRVTHRDDVYHADGRPEAVWEDWPSTDATFAWLHRFEWLKDVLACDDGDSEAFAGAAVDAWIARFGEWDDGAWSPEVIGRRIMCWLAAGDRLFNDSERSVRLRLESLGRQVRHLERTLGVVRPGAHRIVAGAALTAAGVCLSGAGKARDAGLAALSEEVDAQILHDGGHLSRSPEALVDIIADLYAVEAVLAMADTPLPEAIRKSIDRITPMIRFFTLTDGCLASFHGGSEGDRATLAALTATAGGPARTFDYAPHSGYHRIQAGGAILVLDAGPPADGPFGLEAHASCLAFEFSPAGGRLFVNCGWSQDLPEKFHAPARTTAAHTTACLADTNSASLSNLALRRPVTPSKGRITVTSRRNEEERGVWVEGSHEGYLEALGMVHRRALFMDAKGADIRGEDLLFRPLGRGAHKHTGAVPYALRFHLHPDVRANLARDLRSVVLTLASGESWRMRTDTGALAIEQSVYLAAGGAPQPTRQVVLLGAAQHDGALDAPPNRVRWALQKLGRSVAP